MGDWLGTGFVSNQFREYRSFEEARDFAQSLELKSRDEWGKFCKGKMPEKGFLPDDIPADPNQTYKNKGWHGMGDWLGTGIVATRFREYRSFEKAREYVRRLGLKSWAEWQKYCKGEMPEKGFLPDDIPANPKQTYKDKGWISMGDWLSTGSVAPQLREFLPFEEARKYVRSLGLKNGKEWRRFCKGEMPEKGRLPVNIPTNPHRNYKDDGWAGMRDWLGFAE